MPAIMESERPDSPASEDGMATLPFPPVTKSHIMHCSYHYWHPKYRTITPKTRLIPLPKPFLDYLRADGIILPDDDDDDARAEPEWSDDSGIFSASDNPDSSDEEQEDVAATWRPTHDAITSTIASLGGAVLPKLNWSAPKDATWMNANSMECRSAADIYLLLKSSDFITHDLEHAFDDTTPTPEDSDLTPDTIPYHLALRKAFQLNPAVEFRCFVRNGRLLALCQRDLNHFDFLSGMQDRLRSKIQEFFDVRLRDTFPDANFVFDVYVPPPHDRVWLVDVNPWAIRTDPLLFSWLELLTMEEPPEVEKEEELPEMTIRIPFRPASESGGSNLPPELLARFHASRALPELDEEEEEDADEELWQPEFRLVRREDPEAYGFATQQYSAHKLPKDVVDASQSGEGLREFARDWREILEKRVKEEGGESSEESSEAD